jgi:predicted nucleotidyltransferase
MSLTAIATPCLSAKRAGTILATVKKDEAIRILEAPAAEIRARGVTRLALFGSVVRDEAGPESDVDVLVDIDCNAKFARIELSGLRLYLCDILGAETDVAIRGTLRSGMRKRVADEQRQVF